MVARERSAGVPLSTALAGVPFRVSSFCSSGGCVAVALLSDGRVAVRDTKDENLTTLLYTPDEWRDFIAGVKRGEFDVS